MRADGTGGLGEASPLPEYSPDSMSDAADELQRLAARPVAIDPLASPLDILLEVFGSHSVVQPSARFALETALLDWLGHARDEPVHRVLGGAAEPAPIPIADLVHSTEPSAWPARVDQLVADGATHLKLKIGADLPSELDALRSIRDAHPEVPLRLDANRRIPVATLRSQVDALEALELELLEEPVGADDWPTALGLPLPFALDETLRDEALAMQLLQSGRIAAVVIKPMVVGGLRASFAIAERAAEHGARYLVSHSFDGPIARAATAELALALQTELAAGLGVHPALSLWPPHRIAAIHGREIVPHDAAGLGLDFEEDSDD
jgi:L-alanine-DL-glutamate epimerase-like enolase superfamily enzyme